MLCHDEPSMLLPIYVIDSKHLDSSPERGGLCFCPNKPNKKRVSSNLARKRRRNPGIGGRRRIELNSTLTLLRYSAIEGKGWRRGAVVLTKNGKLKPDVMTVGGAEVNCHNGRYQMRRYQGKLPVYTELGNDPTDALNRFRAEESKLNARTAAKAAGLEVVSDDESRKTLKQYAADFLSMHRNLPHRSDDSVRVYTQITSSFLSVCKDRK